MTLISGKKLLNYKNIQFPPSWWTWSWGYQISAQR